MIKIISNKTDSPKIKVESKFLRNKSEILDKSRGYINNITKDDLLFVKLTFTGLSAEQKIGKVQMALCYENARSKHGIKVLKASDTNIKDDKLRDIANKLNSDENVHEAVIIYGSDHSLKQSGMHHIMLDITNIVNMSKAQNPTVMLIIKNTNTTNKGLIIYDPEILAKNNEICSATITEIAGLYSLYKYDEHSIGDCGTGYINLFNGRLIHEIKGFSTLSKKVSITFSLYSNQIKKNKISYMQNNLTPNFQYNFFKLDKDYVLEDPTGKKSYYSLKTFNDYKEANEYGIKHYEKGKEVYFCSFDNSYFYLTNTSNITKILLYDKQNNESTFEITSNGITKILSIKSSLGDYLTYTWSGNYLEKITNSDKEEVLLTYTYNKLSKIEFLDLKRTMEFIYSSNKVLIKTYYIKTKRNASATTEEKEKLSEINLLFNSYGLEKVVDLMAGYELNYHTNLSKQVINVIVKSNSNNVTGYTSTYYYSPNYTTITDYEDNVSYYYFDNYGRVRTEMDSKARTISYNYDEFENGESKNLIGKSNVQNNSRNLLENHSFEDSDNLFHTEMGWKINGVSKSIVKSIYGGVYGEKCLFIDKEAGETITITQQAHANSYGKYSLKGFFKGFAKNKNETINSDDILIKIHSTYYTDETVVINSGSSGGTTTTIRAIGHCPEVISKLKQNEDWTSFKTATLAIPSNAYDIKLYVDIIVKGKACEIYLDDFQLSQEYQLVRYNLVENGYMEYLDENNLPKGFNFENCDYDDYVISLGNSIDHPTCLGKKVMMFSKGDIEGDYSNPLYVKKMFKKITVKGIAGEQLIFTVFAKANVTSNTIFRSYMKINYRNGSYKIHYFDFEKNFDKWQILTRAVTAEYSYDQVELGIEYNGGTTAYIDCFQLYKDAFGKYYNYDKKGNITEVMDSKGTSMKLEYNDDNKVKGLITEDGSSFKYEYDDKGRLSKITDIYFNSITLVYDNKDNIIETITYCKNDNQTYSIKQSFDDKGNVVTSKDEYNQITTRAFDYLNQLTEELSPNGLKINYNYNNYGDLTKMYALVDNLSNSTNISYDYRGNTKEITSSNGTRYNLTYDDFGRLLNIKVNDEVINNLLYTEYANNINRGLLSRKTYGNKGDYYDFKYDDLGQVTEVLFNGNLLVSYKYDENGNISEVIDEKNKVITYNTYDLKGKLIKLTNKNKTLSYTYDNLDNVQKVTYDLNGNQRSFDYEYEYEFNEYTKEGYFQRLDNIFADEIIKGENGGKGSYGAYTTLSSISNSYEENLKMNVFNFQDKYDFLWYDMDKFNSNRSSGYSNGRAFSYTTWKSRFAYNKTFYAWIKPSGNFTKEENIFAFENIEKNNGQMGDIKVLSGLFISNNGNIAYRSMESSKYVCKSNNTLLLNEWNLVGIKLTKPTLSKTSYCQITLNGITSSTYEISENISSINYLIVSHQDVSDVVSGGSSKAGYSNTTRDLTLPFKICFMSFGSHDYTPEEFKGIYAEGKKYFTKDAPQKSNGTIYYNDDVYKNFDVITLNGSLESAKGIKPVELIETDSSFKIEKAKIFKYDEDLEKHVYGSFDGKTNLTPGNTSLLAYRLEMQNQGTISFRFKTDELGSNKCLFSSTKENKEVFGIYIFPNAEIKLLINEKFISTGKYISTKIWHFLALTFDINGYNLYIDNVNISFNGNVKIDLTNNISYLGTTISNNGTILNGLIEMFAFSKMKVDSTVINNIINRGKAIIVRNKLDTLGRITTKQILVNDKEMNTTYSYDKLRIKNERIFDNSSINYSYDAVGNIISKIATGSLKNNINNKYYYDVLGRLIKEVKPDGSIEEFTYDANGNILLHKVTKNNNIIINEQYIYDNVVKDRLLRIKNLKNNSVITEFTYSNSYKGNPSLITIKGNNKNLVWNCRRLVGIGNDIKYTYNENGIRIKKEIPNSVTTFELEGSNVIQMRKIIDNKDYLIDFTYDANGQLIGLTYGGKEYFYDKDITGNINQIVDEEGKCVVKYRYLDAWGNHEVLNNDNTINTSNIFIGNLNPFRYKEYIFDEETNFYYLKSRYYDPSIRRFINQDDINFLDIETLNGINLWSYCNNNPVMYLDSDGRSWKSIKNSVKKFFKKAGNFVKSVIGFQASIGKEITTSFYYFWAFSTETGIGNSVSFDNGKPFNIFVSGPDEWWKIWEYSFGLDINIKGWGLGLSVGTESSLNFHLGRSDLSIFANILGRIGFQYNVQLKDGTYSYFKFKINTPEILLSIYTFQFFISSVGVVLA